MNSFFPDISKVFRENRRLVYGLLLILILVGLIAFRKAYEFHQAAQQEMESKKESIAILSSRLDGGNRPGYEQKPPSLEKGLVQADKPSIAAALIQKSIRAAALKNRVHIISERPLKPVGHGPYLKVPVEFQFKTDTAGLTGFLTDVRSAEPMTGVDGVSIKRSDSGGLEVTMVVLGAMRLQ